MQPSIEKQSLHDRIRRLIGWFFSFLKPRIFATGNTPQKICRITYYQQGQPMSLDLETTKKIADYVADLLEGYGADIFSVEELPAKSEAQSTVESSKPLSYADIMRGTQNVKPDLPTARDS